MPRTAISPDWQPPKLFGLPAVVGSTLYSRFAEDEHLALQIKRDVVAVLPRPRNGNTTCVSCSTPGAGSSAPEAFSLGDLTETSTSRIARQRIDAVTANLEACIWSFRRLPRAELHHDEHLTWVITDIPYTFFNAVVGTRLTDVDVDRVIGDVLKKRGERKVPFRWRVLPRDSPSDLSTHLQAHCLVHRGDGPGMTAVLVDLPAFRGNEVPRGDMRGHGRDTVTLYAAGRLVDFRHVLHLHRSV